MARPEGDELDLDTLDAAGIEGVGEPGGHQEKLMDADFFNAFEDVFDEDDILPQQ